MASASVTCTPNTALRSRTAVIPAGQTGTLTVSPENNAPFSITRLLLAANGTGLAGLAGLTVASMRIGQRYITGGPVMPGLRGGATAAVSAEALVAYFSRAALRSPLTAYPGDDLVIVVANASGAARRVVLTENREAVRQTLGAPALGTAKLAAPQGFAPEPPSTLLAFTATVAAGEQDVRVEIPRGTAAGVVGTFAVHTPTPLSVRVGFSVGKRVVVEPTYPDTLERAQANAVEAGRFYREPLAVGQGETLYMVVSNDGTAPCTVSLFAEMVHQGWDNQGWMQATAAQPALDVFTP